MDYKSAEALRLRAIGVSQSNDVFETERFVRDTGMSPQDYESGMQNRLNAVLRSMAANNPPEGMKPEMHEAMQLVCQRERRLAMYLAVAGEGQAVTKRGEVWFLQKDSDERMQLMHGIIAEGNIYDAESWSSLGLDWVDLGVPDLLRYADLVDQVADDVIGGVQLEAFGVDRDDPAQLVLISSAVLAEKLKPLEQQAADAIESGDPEDAKRFAQATGILPTDLQGRLQTLGPAQVARAITAHRGDKAAQLGHQQSPAWRTQGGIPRFKPQPEATTPPVMERMRVRKLEGDMLAAAVLKAEGATAASLHPSTPDVLMAREGISVLNTNKGWAANDDQLSPIDSHEGQNFPASYMVDVDFCVYGKTPAEAILRCYCIKKLGEYVELPSKDAAATKERSDSPAPGM